MRHVVAQALLLGGWLLLIPPGDESSDEERFLTDRPYSEWVRESDQPEHPTEQACREAKRDLRARTLAGIDADRHIDHEAKEAWKRTIIQLTDEMRCVPAEQARPKTPAAEKTK